MRMTRIKEQIFANVYMLIRVNPLEIRVIRLPFIPFTIPHIVPGHMANGRHFRKLFTRVTREYTTENRIYARRIHFNTEVEHETQYDG